jgi:hypothetical protein
LMLAQTHGVVERNTLKRCATLEAFHYPPMNTMVREGGTKPGALMR